MATHSKSYWCKGGGWLIMVDISYYNYILRCIKTGEGGWLATLSTHSVSAPVYEIRSSEGAGLQTDTGT